MTAQHRDALAHLVYGLNSEGGCILLTGEVGTGKTTICRCLLEQIPEQANVALVLNPKVSEIELLETICDELHIAYPEQDNSVKTYTDRIYRFLIESNSRNEKTLLIIDEAQNLSDAVLEQLRLLTNLETDQRKLLQIIILGQPELLEILARPAMRQLAQRITARFHLQPLSRGELKAYISHRLAVAGQNIQVFPESSISVIYRASKGIPRLINIICDRALLGAYVEDRHQADPSIVRKACREVFGELRQVEQNRRRRSWLIPAAAVLATVATGSVVVHLTSVDTAPDMTATADNMQQLAAATPPVKRNLAAEQDTQDNDDPATSSVDTTETARLETTTASETTGVTASTVGADKVMADTSRLDALLERTAGDNRIDAFQQIFKRWGQQFDSRSGLPACKQATQFSLGCLHRLGNLNSLKQHNRPAVLTLVDNTGNTVYVALTRIEQDIATVIIDGAEHRITLADIDDHWLGKFIVLWHRPDDYRSVIGPGDSGRMVEWLDTQLSDIGIMGRIGGTVYGEQMVQAVKSFQSRQGLIADGIVGPLTIIHLNTESGRAVPSLLPLTARS